MKNIISRTHALALALGVAVIALASWGVAEAMNTVKKMAHDSKNLRVSEVNSCAPTTADAPHFSGCSSII